MTRPDAGGLRPRLGVVLPRRPEAPPAAAARVLEWPYARGRDASASYGARGDKVGRTVAERLQLPFIDRAIPTSAAALGQLGLPEDVGESLDQQAPSRWERMAMRLAGVATPAGPDVLAADVPLTFSPEAFRAESVTELQQVADSTGAVILGRAGMAALGGGLTCCACAWTARSRRGSHRWWPWVSTRRRPARASGTWTTPGRPTPGCSSTPARITTGCTT